MEQMEKVYMCFPPEIRQYFGKMDDYTKKQVEEIRIYRDKPVQLLSKDGCFSIPGRVSSSVINQILNSLMKFSYHAYEEDIAKGFITIDGGHRVGICGKAILENGKVKLIREVSSLNIRCSKEVIGCAEPLMKYIDRPEGVMNTLIVSPPGAGKTTLLRDIAREISLKGYKVGICDERSEIAAMVGGKCSYSFGKMVDVLDGCPKAEGIEMLVRSMSPQVIFTDEIGKVEDGKAIKMCKNCGVKIITTIHGESNEDLRKSDIYSVIEDKIFDLIIFLTSIPKVGTVKEILRG